MPTLGLCVIAKNAAATLRRTLESVSGLVDAMVVVDTGSTDQTMEIAQSAGAAVFPFAWEGDFSTARNAALAEVTTDWVLVLDADEELDRNAHVWIRAELKAARAQAYIVPIRNYQRPWDEPLANDHRVPPKERHPRALDAHTFVHSEVCRLFRRDPAIYYVGPVHEQVEYRLAELGIPIARAGFLIHHFGWYLMRDEDFPAKRAFYCELLKEKLGRSPNDHQVLVQYGDALSYSPATLNESLACFVRALELNPSERAVWLHVAAVLIKKNEPEAALMALQQAPESPQHQGYVAQLTGEACGALQQWEQAREAFELAFRSYPHYSGIEAKLALVEIEVGRKAQGIERMRRVIRAAEARASANPRPDSFLRAAMLHAQMRQWPDALRLIERGLELDRSSAPLHELRLRAAVAAGALKQAGESAEALKHRQPSPQTVMRHASILAHAQRHAEALQVVVQGMSMFPQSDELQRARQELVFAPAR